MKIKGAGMKEFILLSTLRKKAYKKTIDHSDSETSSQWVNQLMGINTVKKKWLNTALSAYDQSQKSKEFRRVQLLQESLLNVYICEYQMKNTGYHDLEIKSLKERAEQSYYNTCLEFIESVIHQEKSLLQNYAVLTQAVALLEEYNSKLAVQYKSLLLRKQSLVQSMNKIQETLELNPEQIDEKHVSQIRSILKHHDQTLRQSPALREEILEDLRMKMDQLLLYYQGLIQKEEKKDAPSFISIHQAYEDFEKLYQPFKEWLVQKRYRDFLEQGEQLQEDYQFLKKEYPKLLEHYQYYSLPRKQIDKRKLLSIKKDAEQFKRFASLNFTEFMNLNPDIKQIIQRFDELLSEEFKDDLLNYYKIHNELVNAEDLNEKIPELVRFIKHLNMKINEDAQHYLKEKLQDLANECLQSLDESIQKLLKMQLTGNNQVERLKENFDRMLNYLYDLGDLKRIEELQNQKKLLIKALNELNQWMNELNHDFESYEQLPESPLKIKLKHSLHEQCERIHEILPLLNQYKILNIKDISHQIYRIEQETADKTEENEAQNQRLLVFDNFTMNNYIFLSKEQIRIGREEDNDIIIASDWVSANHCTINVKKGFLRDNSSTNGTYIGFKQKRISETPLKEISTINIAEAFEFEMIVLPGSIEHTVYMFRLNKITEMEIIQNFEMREVLQSLFNTTFIFFAGDGEVRFDTEQGQLLDEYYATIPESISVICRSGNFYILDPKRSAKEQLMIKEQKETLGQRFSCLLT